MMFRDPTVRLALAGLLLGLAPGCAAQEAPEADVTREALAVPDWVPPAALAIAQQRIDFGQNSTIAIAFVDESGTAYHTVVRSTPTAWTSTRSTRSARSRRRSPGCFSPTW